MTQTWYAHMNKRKKKKGTGRDGVLPKLGKMKKLLS
jgi:hypothetical protein